jgi:RNA polymerase subunit RPABC4/transcription elongation factor Spt4
MGSKANGCTCGDADFVPIVDMNLMPSHVGGNKYARFCMSCGRRRFCAARYFEKADDKHVIAYGDDWPVPLKLLCHNCERPVPEGADTCPSCSTEVFDCPKCSEPVSGEPDECPHCGAGYVWSDTSAESESNTQSTA